jgi:Carboxypeptidase regulatory-like domain
MYKRSVSIFLLFFPLVFSGFGQSISGSIAGRVVDQQGAVVANASVTIVEPTKNVTVNVNTGEGGRLQLPGFTAGRLQHYCREPRL